MVYAIVITLAAGYLLGNLNGAVLFSRLFAHDDVRNYGSGNAGFTNFFRNFGGFNSLLVILIDGIKALAACLLGKYLLGQYGLALEGAALGAVAVALGHDFPALLGFRGGKGIVCGFASALVMDWRAALIIFVIFAVFYFTTKYVSLCSILGAVGLAISFTLLHSDRPLACAGCLFVCILAIWMHRENIGRLIRGNERKTDFFKKERKK